MCHELQLFKLQDSYTSDDDSWMIYNQNSCRRRESICFSVIIASNTAAVIKS